MTPGRRRFHRLAAGLPWLALAQAAAAPSHQDAAVLALAQEPPALDPTLAASPAVGEALHYNVFEGLTKVQMDGTVAPLLAESWFHSPDGKAYTFRLRRGVRFSDGSPLDAAAVKFSFERARAAGGRNRAKKTLFEALSSVATPDAHTVILVFDQADATLPFRLGDSPAVILHPATAAQAASRPVGTGPYRVERWRRGTALTLAAWPGHRAAAATKLRQVELRFLGDAAAQLAALRAGEVDALPRFDALALPQALKALQADPRFVVAVGATAGKGLLGINHRHRPLDDLRVRRALCHAVDRAAFIAAVRGGLGWPIGSHFAPTDAGYLDLTGLYPHDPERARALLKDAGMATPLKLTLALPPPAYARQGGELIAAQLARAGIQVRLEKLEWTPWLAAAAQGRFELALLYHAEPLDHAAAYADPKALYGYDSAAFRQRLATLAATADPPARARLWQEVQRQLAEDAANVFLWSGAQVSVARAGLRGLWTQSPIVANELAALRWAAPTPRTP